MKLLALMTMLVLTPLMASEQILLTLDNSVSLIGRVTSKKIKDLSKEIIALHRKRDKDVPLYVVMKSPGGSIFAGNNFIRLLNSLGNVHTICIECYSMAHAISQGVNGRRYGTFDNIMMAHRASMSLSGQFGYGEIESRLGILKKIVYKMEQRAAHRIRITINKYRGLIKDEWWTTGAESVRKRVLDDLVSLKCSDKLLYATKKTTVYTMFGKVAGVPKSKCPLVP